MKRIVCVLVGIVLFIFLSSASASEQLFDNHTTAISRVLGSPSADQWFGTKAMRSILTYHLLCDFRDQEVSSINSGTTFLHSVINGPSLDNESYVGRFGQNLYVGFADEKNNRVVLITIRPDIAIQDASFDIYFANDSHKDMSTFELLENIMQVYCYDGYFKNDIVSLRFIHYEYGENLKEDEKDIPYRRDGFEFELLNDNSFAISDYFGEDVDELIIPTELDGHPVNAIKSLGKLHNISTLIVPEGIISLCNDAFEYCSIKKICLPSSLQNIDGNPFSHYPSGMLSIPDTNQWYKVIDGNVYSKDGDKLIAYSCYPSEETFILPEGVIEIGSYAFRYNSDLHMVLLPNSLVAIGEYAFFRCDKLQSIIIPEGVTEICEGVFSDCYNLSSIQLPNSLKKLGEFSLAMCWNLEEIIIPENVTRIEKMTFAGSGSGNLQITIPRSVSYFSDEAFTLTTGFTLNVYKDSYAYSYCKENDINCHLID